jgi:hypothetical protein
MKRFSLVLLFGLLAFHSFGQKKAFPFSISLESGLNRNKYEMGISTSAAEVDHRPALGNFVKITGSYNLFSIVSWNNSIGYSGEKLVAQVRRTAGGGSVTYPYEVNALQHFIDLESNLSFNLRISSGASIIPSFGFGTGVGMGEQSNSYSYLLPGFKFQYGRAFLGASYKYAHYNVQAAQNPEWFETLPLQYLVRPRVLQVGLGYQITK